MTNFHFLNIGVHSYQLFFDIFSHSKYLEKRKKNNSQLLDEETEAHEVSKYFLILYR